MLKEQSVIIRRLVVFSDALLLLSAFFLAFFLRFRHFPSVHDLKIYGWAIIAFIFIFLYSLYKLKIYHQLRYISQVDIAKKVASAFFFAFILSSALIFQVHALYYSRLLFLYFSFASFLLVLLAKLALKFFLNQLRSRGYNFRQILVVGSGEKLKQITTFFQRHKNYGIKIFAAYNHDEITPARLAEILTENVIDEIYFAFSRSAGVHPAVIDAYLEIVEKAGKTSRILLNINENHYSHFDFARLDGLPLVVLHPVNLDPDQLLLKRLVDILGAVVGLALNVMFFPVLAIAIKMDSPGPIFFKQQRVGQNGRLFNLYKYRSMVQNAEKRLGELSGQNEMSGAVFKITNDPRVTRVGRILRALSLDELPQFWNVLKGEMSLVGTRPPLPHEVKEYQLHHYRRLSIKPGITGLWQVSGRNDIADFEQMVKLDTKYIDKWSIWLDLLIIAKTFKVLCKGK